MIGIVPAFQSAAWLRFTAGSENLISILGLGVYPLSVFCPVFSLALALTLCWPHIQGSPPLCICLVFWSRFCCSPYTHITHRHLGCKSREVYSLWETTWDKILKVDRKWFTLSLAQLLLWCWRHWCHPFHHFCERDSGGLFNCGALIFIFILTIDISPWTARQVT